MSTAAPVSSKETQEAAVGMKDFRFWFYSDL
jgi:hypothetical protein